MCFMLAWFGYVCIMHYNSIEKNSTVIYLNVLENNEVTEEQSNYREVILIVNN